MDRPESQKRGTQVLASVNRMWVLFDSQGTEIARDSLKTQATQRETVNDPGVLWVDQVTTEVKPGHYLMAVRVTDPASGNCKFTGNSSM